MMTNQTDLTRDLLELVEIASNEDASDDLLRRGLDWLARIAPYELATIFLLEGTDLRIRMARGALATPALRGHTLSLAAFPTIREALETRRARAFTEQDHAHGDGDPFDGVLDLPHGHSCMVVPLCAGSRAYGVMTLDRTRCELYPAHVVNLCEVYGAMLGLAIALAEQRALLQRLRRTDVDRERLLEAELEGEAHALDSSASPAMREVTRRAAQVALTDTAVLLLGETGTGKERLAHAIHRWSRRAEQPFVKINCAAIPEKLLESELFGHVKGAFTGATRDRAGRFQMANGGTLLLDEIGELPHELQAKLLRVLQEGTFEPVGSDRTVKVDVRILAATHVDLPQAIRDRRFREDLYYRLNVFPLRLPPLRERLEDMEQLCEAMLAEQAERTGRQGFRVTRAGHDALRQYAWPGNLRELANVLERATILASEPSLGPDVLDVDKGQLAVRPRPTTEAPPELATLEDMERRHIEAILAHTAGRVYGAGGAAKILGLKPSTLQSRMKKLGVKRAAP